MSVTIHWAPTARKDKHFKGGTSSSLKIVLQQIGEIIAPCDAGRLRDMYAASGDEFYKEVADAVDVFGEIKIWGEY